MNLTMSGLDCHSAAISLREQLAFSATQIPEVIKKLNKLSGISGCVLLSTCNRTELYLSGDVETSPWRLLCRVAGVEEDPFEPYFTTRCGEDAAQHLMEVCCGIHSQILGDAQIITQVRTAMELSQEAQCMDAQLSALFRQAVTAGKRARTEVSITRGISSLGTRCLAVLEEKLGDLEGRKVLVVGNGQMGRHVAELLRDAGARVRMTLRSYHHGQTIVPMGCRTIPYEERISYLEQVDAVVSATASPHYTIRREDLQHLDRLPQIAIDLAVPRDIDPACSQLIPCLDTDALGMDTPGSSEELAQMQQIAKEELERFRKWKRMQQLEKKHPRFPMFIDLAGKKVVMVGGGTIASRRISVLRQFGCEITVIAPELKCKAEGLKWIAREYRPGDLEGAYLAVSATPHREVNRQVGLDANALGIPVSVADSEAECSFYFPAVCLGEDLIAGVVSTGKHHHKTARAAREIRRVLEEVK